MFKQDALKPFEDRSQALQMDIVMGAVKEALLLTRHLDQIKESIAFFISQARTENSFALAVQFWDNIVVARVNALISTNWQYISDEITIIEHAGLSTYAVNWVDQFAEQAKSISIRLQTTKDFLDVRQIAMMAQKMQDLITTTKYTVEVYLMEYVRSSCGEIEYQNPPKDYLHLENEI